MAISGTFHSRRVDGFGDVFEIVGESPTGPWRAVLRDLGGFLYTYPEGADSRTRAAIRRVAANAFKEHEERAHEFL